MSSYYTEKELGMLKLARIGRNVLISRKASIYGSENIEIGENVRIDDFCILSGKIKLGNNVHIASGTYLWGGGKGIIMANYSAVSSHSSVYACTDDYSGKALANAALPNKYRNVLEEQVFIGKYTVVGSGCTILPGVVIGEGVAVGAMSLVNKSLEDWGIYAGVPCRKIKERNRGVLNKVIMFEMETGNGRRSETEE